MKRNAIILVMVSAVYLISACSGGGGMKKVESGHSEMQAVANKLVQDGGLAVVGTGISTREDLARKKAKQDGMLGLSQAIETKVKGYQKDFVEEIGTAGETEVNEAFQSVSQSLTKTVLVGAMTVDEAVYMDEGKYTIYTVVSIDPKTFIQSFQDQMKEQKALYTRYRQSEMNKEMEQKLEDYDNF